MGDLVRGALISIPRHRYALRVLIDMAEHQADGVIPLKGVAKRQEISEKYLEAILKTLVKNGVITGTRGKGGGYRFNRPAAQVIAAIAEAAGASADGKGPADDALPLFPGGVFDQKGFHKHDLLICVPKEYIVMDDFKVMLPTAMNFGVAAVEIKEIVYQAAAYLGMGRVFPFIKAAPASPYVVSRKLRKLVYRLWNRNYF